MFPKPGLAKAVAALEMVDGEDGRAPSALIQHRFALKWNYRSRVISDSIRRGQCGHRASLVREKQRAGTSLQPGAPGDKCEGHHGVLWSPGLRVILGVRLLCSRRHLPTPACLRPPCRGVRYRPGALPSGHLLFLSSLLAVALGVSHPRSFCSSTFCPVSDQDTACDTHTVGQSPAGP